jgi:hypothetical protein
MSPCLMLSPIETSLWSLENASSLNEKSLNYNCLYKPSAEAKLEDPLQQTLENKIAERLAYELWRHLPVDDVERQALLESGQALAKQLSWDRFIQEQLQPVLYRLADQQGLVRWESEPPVLK